MKTELEKLESKRDEMQAELATLRPQQARYTHVINRVIWLSTALCDCDKMITDARLSAVFKHRTTP